MSLLDDIFLEFSKTYLLKSDEQKKKEVFFSAVDMICYRFLKMEKRIFTEDIFKKINIILDRYCFENNEELATDDNIIRPDIISKLYYKIFLKNSRNAKENGVFYTSNEFSRKFTKKLFTDNLMRKCGFLDSVDCISEDEVLKMNHINDIDKYIRKCRILDLGCGTGNLIVNMIINIYKIVKKLKLNVSLTTIINNCTAIDIDENALRILKVRLALLICKESSVEMCSEVFDKIYNLDVFDGVHYGNIFEELHLSKNKYDITISNPPYFTISKVELESYIDVYSINNTRDFDITYLFMLKMLRCIKYYGMIGLITTNKYLQNDSAECIRRIIYEKFTFLSISVIEDNIYDEEVQALPVVTILEFRGNKVEFSDSTFNSNHILDVNNGYKINLIDNEVYTLKKRLFKLGNKLQSYFNIEKGKAKKEKIKEKDIFKYKIGNMSSYEISNNSIIIIPSICEINRFATIEKENKKVVGEATIILESKCTLINIYSALGILNSELIYFCMLVTGKYTSKNTLRITIDILGNIPYFKNDSLEYKIGQVVKDNIDNIDSFINEINNLVYELYSVSSKEKELIRNYISKYEKNENISSKFLK